MSIEWKVREEWHFRERVAALHATDTETGRTWAALVPSHRQTFEYISELRRRGEAALNQEREQIRAARTERWDDSMLRANQAAQARHFYATTTSNSRQRTLFQERYLESERLQRESTAWEAEWQEIARRMGVLQDRLKPESKKKAYQLSDFQAKKPVVNRNKKALP